jgi:tRNA-2-methylthio-N6-dimethylallyladenosine synthase
MTSKGEVIDPEKPTTNFAQLMEMVALVSPDLRIRFSTSHPKDMTDDVLEIMAKYENICKYIHLPVQSGNSEILEKMNRGYSREWYLDRIAAIRKFMPDCAISTDVIAGFCGETEAQHQDTVSLMKEVRFDFAYMFKYSERPKTLAERKYADDIPEEEKNRRLNEIIQLQQQHSLESNQRAVGKTFRVLVEGVSKRSDAHLFGRNSQNAVIVFPRLQFEKGQYVDVLVESCTAATLIGQPVI